MAAKPRKKRAVGGGIDEIAPETVPQDMDVIIDAEGTSPDEFTPGEAIEIPLEDGSLVIDLNPQRPENKNTKFGDNLAEVLDAGTLNDIAMTLIEAIDEDDEDRREWLQMRADGLDLLGLKVEGAKSGVGTSAMSAEGQSTVRDPLLAEAIDRFQASAYGELCPAEGPCKAEYYGPETADSDSLADDFQKDFNFYLASGVKGTATEYYPDTRQMLWWVGYASGMFKKVYSCPIRRRPVSESVDGEYLIIPSNVTDLDNAGRITQVIFMRQSVMKRMQLLGVYRDVTLGTPNPEWTPLDRKKADITGMDLNQNRPEDQDYTVYECYCELDIPGFEHKDKKGRPTGLPLPYRVAIDKDSRTVLEIRRNWDENDADQKAKIPFILFPYTTGLSIYGTGLLHRLGNASVALTAMQRELIDAGAFASFPGFLFAKQAGRQLDNNFRVPPGGGAPIDTGGGDIRTTIMPLPYKDPSPALVQMRQQVREEAFRFANMADMPIGEGRQDAPVGTTIALIEQGMKVVSGILKDLHAAQKRELNMIKELFKEDPEALWRNNPRPALGGNAEQRKKRWLDALENCELVPASDPNEPSAMHRAGKAEALLKLTRGDPRYDPTAVDRRVFALLKLGEVDPLLSPPQQGQPDPMMVAQLQLKNRELDIKEFAVQQKAQHDQRLLQSKEQIEAMKIAGAQQPGEQDPYKGHELDLKNRALDLQHAKMAVDNYNEDANRKSREAIEAMKIAQTVGVHPEADGVVDQQLAEMKPFLAPATQSGSAPMADGGAAEIIPPEPDNDRDLAWAITHFLKTYRPRG